MSTRYHPHGYCVLCGAPKAHILDLRCQDCTLRSEQTYFSTETTSAPAGYYYSNSTAPLCDRDTAIELPALTTRPCDVEEVTGDRASRVKQGILEVLWLHQVECADCKRLAKIDLICVEQIILWRALQFWEKHITEE